MVGLLLVVIMSVSVCFGFSCLGIWVYCWVFDWFGLFVMVWFSGCLLVCTLNGWLWIGWFWRVSLVVCFNGFASLAMFLV